jgi:hypothetical protein
MTDGGRSVPKLSDDAEFMGYPFTSAPPHQPRLWFLERQLYGLIIYGQYTVARNERMVGRWTVNVPRDWEVIEWSSDNPYEVVRMAMEGIHLRWQDFDTEKVIVWRLTGLTIPQQYDRAEVDTWRLGLWPD